MEDALAKLDALAKRQEELANQQHNPQQSFQERWQQEMLRREAEQLQRQMEQLAKNGQPNASGSPSEQSGLAVIAPARWQPRFRRRIFRVIFRFGVADNLRIKQTAGSNRR